jgi:SAM-dependent methyltransferase
MELMEARYQREREFHNQAFSEGGRKEVGRFYAIARSSGAFYEQLLRDLSAGRRVLEYGCGLGSYSFILARRGARVTGIDISEIAVEQTQAHARREQIPTINFQRMNAEALGFADQTFDLVCGRAVLHHLDLNKALAELARVLRPDGLAVFIEPLGHNPLINLYRRLTPHLRTADEHPLFMSDLRMLERYFGRVEGRFFHLQSLLAVPFQGLPGFARLVKWLDGADQGLFKLAPFSRRFAWTVVLKLSQPKR